MKNKFMQRAIELSIKSVDSGGGPFGSVITKGNEIIAAAVITKVVKVIVSIFFKLYARIDDIT